MDRRTYSTVQRIWSRRVGGYKGQYELHHWFTPQSSGGTSAGWNLVAISPRLNRMMSDGGLAYDAFKAVFIGTYLGYSGAIPTVVSRQLSNGGDCSCHDQ